MEIFFANPYRPGAGHMPPYLAGRDREQAEFRKLLEQDVILSNVVLTGLRGVGKTVLLDRFRDIAREAGWKWVGTDVSESTSLTEERIVTRLLADLAVVTSQIEIGSKETRAKIGFLAERTRQRQTLDYELLVRIHDATPGLPSDKLRAVLEFAWQVMSPQELVFAYDEAQNLADHAEDKQFPLALLLDVFQSIQRRGVCFMLILSGLPTLFPKLVESRTFSERMFRVFNVERLDEESSREAIVRPLERAPERFTDASVQKIIEVSEGYPYFIQFFCREAFDVVLRGPKEGPQEIPIPDLLRKLDNDFFMGRWARTTDRQRELLALAAQVEHDDDEEFTVQEIVERSRAVSAKPFSNSHVNQMLGTLCDAGLVYKNRHGKYSFAVPLFGSFVRRQVEGDEAARRSAGGKKKRAKKPR
ncbi:MAG TPA: AAA family ATPase [Nannocystis sp.]